MGCTPSEAPASAHAPTYTSHAIPGEKPRDRRFCGAGTPIALDRTVAVTGIKRLRPDAQVAWSGRRAVIGNALVAPIGAAPARAVIAARRATPFRPPEIELVYELAHGVAAAFARLVR